MRSIIIGVDGGGTKTKISAVEDGGNVLRSARGGSINYNNIGVEKAFVNLKSTMDELRIDYSKVRAVSIGDPAQDDICINPHTEHFIGKIRKYILPDPSTEIFAKSDVYMALYGLTQGKPGVLIVSGTGSMGVAIDDNGDFYVSGGWGFPASDTGSGYDIAVNAFQYIFEAYDKYGYHNIGKPGGMLAKAALEYYDVSHPRELINCFHGEHKNRSKVAEFSKIVYYCAERGSAEATKILERAGKQLAECVFHLTRKLNCRKNPDPLIGIYGSVLTQNPYVRLSFQKSILRKYPQADIVEANTPPEYAAVIYAKHRIEQEKEADCHAVY